MLVVKLAVILMIFVETSFIYEEKIIGLVKRNAEEKKKRWKNQGEKGS
jgi:hypothetical protein